MSQETPKLRVSQSVEADRHPSCRLAKLAHEESLFSDIAFSEDKYFQAFENTLKEPTKYLGIKVMLGDQMLGYCYALLGDYYIGEGAKVVTVISVFTDPSVRGKMLGGRVALRLIRGVETWAKGMGAAHVLYHVTSGVNPAGSDRLFRKLGFTTLGGNYSKAVT